jgi:recombination associated protein RdgC
MTWFKNLTIYKLEGFPVTPERLAELLENSRFKPCGDFQDRTSGFVNPRNVEEPGALVYTLEGSHLMSICTEKKLLPGSVVRTEVARLAVEFEKEKGFKPGKKIRKELKERAIEELLPKAFATRSYTRVWIDTRGGFLVIDTSSTSRADNIISALIRLIEQPIRMRQLRTLEEPAARMSEWIFEAPDGFTVDADGTVFSLASDSKANVKYTHVTPDEDTARKQIEEGKRVTSLALTYDDKVSFTLTGAGAIKRISPLGVLAVKKKEMDDETFAADFLLMTGELRQLIREVCEVLGGIKPYEADLADQGTDYTDVSRAAGGNWPDDHYPAPDGEDDEDGDELYAEAVRQVRRENRASISFVQRVLRIGYNRAARLLEQMESEGVVSALDSSGSRTVRGLHAI